MRSSCLVLVLCGLQFGSTYQQVRSEDHSDDEFHSEDEEEGDDGEDGDRYEDGFIWDTNGKRDQYGQLPKVPPNSRTPAIDGATLPGHNMPFGGHMASMGSIDEHDGNMEPHQFWTEYVQKWRPVILRGAAKSSAAFQKWDEKYLREKFPNVAMKIERPAEKRKSPFYARYKMSRFLDEYKSGTVGKGGIYAVSIMPDEMAEEFEVMPAVLCGDRRKSKIPNEKHPWLTLIYEADLWISHLKTSSQLHYDADENVNCLISGRKEWVFVNTREHWTDIPWSEGKFPGPDKNGGFEHTATDYSPFDPLKVDMEKFPTLQNVKYQRVMQEAGDCIFLPTGYLHQVTKPNVGLSTAVSYMFMPNEKYAGPEVCANAPRSPLPLSAFDIAYYYSGYGLIPQGYDCPFTTARSLIHFIKVKQKKEGAGITFEQFELFYRKSAKAPPTTQKMQFKLYSPKRLYTDFIAGNMTPKVRSKLTSKRLRVDHVSSAHHSIKMQMVFAFDEGIEEINYGKSLQYQFVPEWYGERSSKAIEQVLQKEAAAKKQSSDAYNGKHEGQASSQLPTDDL